MTALAFTVTGAKAERFAVTPTIALQLRVTEATGTPVHAVALRCQIRIEPQRRRYDRDDRDRLYELFGESTQWGDTVRPFLWTHVSTTIPAFTGEIDVDLPIACTYDFEVTGTKYMHALADGEIPLVLLFSGTAFTVNGGALSVEPVPWHAEASYRLPVQVWRRMMDIYFPNSGWMRVRRETLDAVTRFKAARALPSWDHALEQLLKEAGEST